MEFPSSLEDLFQPHGVLGKGGTGTVFAAVHRATSHRVAVKVLDFQLEDDASARSRFQEEARLAQRVVSPHVAGIVTSGEAGGAFYIAYERVDGQSLRTLLDQRGKLPWREAEVLVKGILIGLRAIHDQDIIHRDLKPSNVLVGADGSPRIIDFGVAHDTIARERRTRTGEILGTPWYLSPEQIEGGEVSEATDLYSLGILAYELVSGSPPFTGNSLYQVLGAQCSQRPPPLGPKAPDMPEHVVRVIHQLLEKKPEDRMQDAALVLERIDPAAAARSRSLRRSSPQYRWVLFSLSALTLVAMMLARRMSRPPPTRVSIPRIVISVTPGTSLEREAMDLLEALSPVPRASPANAAPVGAAAFEKLLGALVAREPGTRVPWDLAMGGQPLAECLHETLVRLRDAGTLPGSSLDRDLENLAAREFDQPGYWRVAAALQQARREPRRSCWSALRGLYLGGEGHRPALFRVLADVVAPAPAGPREGGIGLADLWELFFLRAAWATSAAVGPVGATMEPPREDPAICRLHARLLLLGYPGAARLVADQRAERALPCAESQLPTGNVAPNLLGLRRVVEHREAHRIARAARDRDAALRELLMGLEQMFQFPQDPDRDRRLAELLTLLSEELLAGDGVRSPAGLPADPAAYLYLAIMPIDIALHLMHGSPHVERRHELEAERRRLAHRIGG